MATQYRTKNGLIIVNGYVRVLSHERHYDAVVLTIDSLRRNLTVQDVQRGAIKTVSVDWVYPIN